MFNPIQKQAALILLFILVTPLAAAGQRLHPKIKEGKLTPNRLVILPANVVLTKDGMKGAEPMEKEAATAKPVIEQAVAKALSQKQLAVLDSPFSLEALQGDEKLKYALADLQRNYGELLAKINRKKKDVEKGRFTLGDQVLLLNQDDSIDAFVFINAFGQQKTGGKKALAMITLNPLLLLPVYFVTLAVADARTGDILAYAEAFTIFDITKPDDKKLIEVLGKSLKKLPAASTARSQ